MKILAIETSSKVCAVALFEDDKLIKELISEDENTHSVKLMPLIDELLKQTNTNVKDIDLFAVDKGPGSFTGIRIGIATAKAFVDVTESKIIGITSLEALAYNIEQDGIICSIIDARNDNVYCGLFERKNNIVKKYGDLEFSSINELLVRLTKLDKNIIFIGSGAIVHKEIINNQLKEKAIFIENESSNKLNARNIALAAFNNKEKAGNSNSILPTYLRKSNAER